MKQETIKHLDNACKDRKYLVTGASGFIGKAVCERLLNAGSIVHGVARRELSMQSDRWSYTALDMTDGSAVDALFDAVKPDFVIHLASCVTGKREIEWVRETMAHNLVSAIHVMTAAQNSGVTKCILAGSLEEPGATDVPAVPASPYAASKWCASAYARMMHALYGLEVAVARIFMVYGPGQQDLNKLIPYVCLSANRAEAPKLMSGGRLVDWVYIDDVVEGLIHMTHSGPVNGDYVELGSGNLVTTGEVAERICSIAGTGVTPELGAIPDRATEQVRVADIESTKSILGWEAHTELEEGLKATYRFYQTSASENKKA